MTSPAHTPQQLELARVKARIGPAVELFWRRRAAHEERFTGDELFGYVSRLIPGVAPDSPRRVMDTLRAEGTVNYVLLDRARSLYRALPLGHAVTRDVRRKSVLQELREENARLRDLLERAGIMADGEVSP